MKSENKRAAIGIALFVTFGLGWGIGNSSSPEVEAPPPEVKVKTVTETKVVEKEVPGVLPEDCVGAIASMEAIEDNMDKMDRAAGQIGLLASDVQKFSAVQDWNSTVLTIEELNGQIDILDSEVIDKSANIYEINTQLEACQDQVR